MINKDAMVKHTRANKKYELRKILTYCEKKILKASKNGDYSVKLVDRKIDKYKFEIYEYYRDKGFEANIYQGRSENYLIVSWFE
ncbi:MAG: hypothetical protein RR359_02785 [Bacilli bacterium]